MTRSRTPGETFTVKRGERPVMLRMLTPHELNEAVVDAATCDFVDISVPARVSAPIRDVAPTCP